MSEEKVANIPWNPLESDPEILTEYSHEIGLSKKWRFSELFGLDEELLGMVSQPVLAVILLHPLKGEQHNITSKLDNNAPFFLEQIRDLGNACGIIAVVHAIANNTESGILESGALKTYLEQTKSLSALERGKFLANFSGIQSVHEKFANKGQSTKGEELESVDYHYICFVKHQNKLYELDGLKDPVAHKETTSENFFKDAVGVIRENFFEKNNGNIDFAMMVLNPSD